MVTGLPAAPPAAPLPETVDSEVVTKVVPSLVTVLTTEVTEAGLWIQLLMGQISTDHAVRKYLQQQR